MMLTPLLLYMRPALYIYLTVASIAFCICVICDNVYANTTYTLLGQLDAVNIEPIIKGLHSAKPTDTITIKIQSRGGNIYSGLDLIKAMNESKARSIIVRIHEYALSVAGLVALQADKIILDPNAELDFGIVNDAQQDTAVLKSTSKQGSTQYITWFKDVLEHKNIYQLTESEWSTTA